jgi:uncharacterized membrane protein YccC
MTDAVATHRTPTASGDATLLSSLREAVVTMLAAIATLLCTLAIANGPGPAVLAVVLCLSLSRSQLDRDWRHRIEAAIALPIVGLTAVGVGMLLQRVPWVGAAVFVAGMFVSIWLRRFGSIAQRLGSLIALPFVVLLVTPHIPEEPASSISAPLLPIVVALLALLWVSALHALARRIGFFPPPRVARHVHAEAARASTLRPSASTRMAIQMATALALSFVVGFVFFGNRWTWIVLTAFIVISGNRGRLDVAYKSVLRVAGAAAGTILALSFTSHVSSSGTITGALILIAIFIGVWLRPLGYAWWAMFVTIALALLQGFADAAPSQILLPRLEEIVIGAIIGVAVAWWILPVRSTGVLRRRIADALSALGAALDPTTEQRTPDGFIAAITNVEQLAPAFRASRLFTRGSRASKPADWIDTLVACRYRAIALIESGEAPADVRRAIGAARKAQLEPPTLLPALQELQRTLAQDPVGKTEY